MRAAHPQCEGDAEVLFKVLTWQEPNDAINSMPK